VAQVSKIQEIENRKKEHLELCATDAVAFKTKSAGFEKYDFLHCATTEVGLKKISLKSEFFKKTIDIPFIISCMTGGTDDANNINLQLAETAKTLNIPLGLGSMRFALATTRHDNVFKNIRKASGNVPLLANIGAAQIIEMKKNFDALKRLADIIESDAFVVHLNPLQELLQRDGQADMHGLLSAIKQFVKEIHVPVIIKEVGSGISHRDAKKLLDAGVKGIDVAGAGGTSWGGVEILRNGDGKNSEFWDWGIPTSYSIKEIAKLKRNRKFILIGSGGINSAFDAAKALALGADYIASARTILQTLQSKGSDGTIALITDWFDIIKKIMYLTGCDSLKKFNAPVLIKKENFT
jgi:isopentenyl-diphosphate delta-isomerase